MTREKLMEKTMDALSKLPDKKLKEVSDFVEFLYNKAEDKELTDGILQIAADSKSFRFLDDKEDLYSVSDLEEKSVVPNTVTRFKGLLSNEEADKFQEYLKQIRSGWNRDI